MQWSSPAKDVCRPHGLSDEPPPASVATVSACAGFLSACCAAGCSFELPQAVAASAARADTMARGEVNRFIALSFGVRCCLRRADSSNTPGARLCGGGPLSRSELSFSIGAFLGAERWNFPLLERMLVRVLCGRCAPRRMGSAWRVHDRVTRCDSWPSWVH